MLMTETLIASADAVIEAVAESVDAVSETVVEAAEALAETAVESADAVMETVMETLEAGAEATVVEAEAVAETIVKGGSSMHFEGIAGAINVSIVAFSIVFGVLLVLTGVIYGMKFFAGGGEKKNDVVPAKPSASPAPKPVLAKSVSTPAPSGDKTKIIAAITAAIIEFTGSADFRILSVQPEGQEQQVTRDYWTRRWKAAGMLSLNANRLNRKWH